jgi:ribosomal protein S18 acetylase RimI-like enzyme
MDNETLSDSDIASIERATLDAVAPEEVRTYGDWLLPFDPSTIGRARSAVPLRHANLGPTALPGILQQYAARDLTPAFRLADVPAMAEIQAALRDLGLRAEQPTLVQIGSTQHMRGVCAEVPASVQEQPHTLWASVYLGAGFDPVDGAHRVQALSRSSTVVYACVAECDEARASGTASFSHGWASVHGMRTALAHRGQGLAKRILGGLADAALALGLERVFLQVEEENTAAQALYRHAGFQTAWRYHYWRPVVSSTE